MNNGPPWYMPLFLKPLLLSFQCCLQKFYFVEKIPCKGKITESRYFFCHLSLLHEEIEKKLRLEKYFRRFCEKFLFKLILIPIKVKTNYKYTKLYFIAKSKRLIHSQSDSDDSSIFKIILNVKVIRDWVWLRPLWSIQTTLFTHSEYKIHFNFLNFNHYFAWNPFLNDLSFLR